MSNDPHPNLALLTEMVERELPCHGCDHGSMPRAPKRHEHWCPYTLRPRILAAMVKVWNMACEANQGIMVSTDPKRFNYAKAYKLMLAIKLPDPEVRDGE